jgi:histidinol dehydrogenase
VYTSDEARARSRRHIASYIEPISEAARQLLVDLFGKVLTPAEAVARIIGDVRTRGDEALRDWSRDLDNWGAPENEPLLVSDLDIIEAYDRVPGDIVEALEAAAERVSRFHQRQPATGWLAEETGGWRGQLVRPLERVAIYVPARGARLGRLFAAAAPARAAGVDEIFVCTPPDANGKLAPELLIAADIAGIDALYRAGHASAIAACAYGTESIPRADTIVGSDDVFIREALRQVRGVTGVIDLGEPADAVLVVDQSAAVEQVAADLIAQVASEASGDVLVIACGSEVAEKLQAAVEACGEDTARAAALAAHAGLVTVADVAEALALADDLAPSRAVLAVRDPWEAARGVRHAGAVYLGLHTGTALGDPVAGPGGLLPGAGAARFASPLSVRDFVRLTNVVALTEEDAAEWSATAEALTRAEASTRDGERTLTVGRKGDTDGRA